jgi:hypothetical protein
MSAELSSVAMIMHAREIPECITPLKRLNLDKVWFRGFMQVQVEKEIRRFVRSTDYDRYILISDDVVMTQKALDAVLMWQKSFDILTGWCNLSPERWRANVILNPLKDVPYYRMGKRIPRFAGRHVAGLISGGIFPFKHLYEAVAFRSFPACSEIANLPEVFQTYFMGGPLLSMKKEHWLKYGFESPSWGGPAFGADMALSKQITEDGMKMWCVRDAFVYHLHTTRNFLVGKVEPVTIHERIAEPLSNGDFEVHVY